MATGSASPLGSLARFPLEIRRIIYDFTLDQSEQDYHFEVEANNVLHVPEVTTSLPRATPVLAHVCGEMRDHFLENHTQITFTCAIYTRSCTEGGCWEEKADSRNPQLSRTGWFNRRSDKVTFSRHELLPPPTGAECSTSPLTTDESPDATQLHGKPGRELLLSVEPHHMTDFVRLVENARSEFVQKNPDEETRVYSMGFHDIIHQGTTVLVRRCWCA